MSMRRCLFTILFSVAITTLNAQEPWRQVLSVDPLMANGYFIVNPEKAVSLNLASLQVDIVVDKPLGGGQVQHTVVESFTLADTHYGHLDPSLLEDLAADEVWHYELHGYDAFTMPVVDVSSIRPGGRVWPESCRRACVSDQYAWAIVGYSDGAQTYMELQNAVNPVTSSYYYFFVPSAEWSAFKSNNPDPSVFGLGQEWSWYETAVLDGPEQNDVLRLTSIAWGSPAVNGSAIGANYAGQPGWAIRKDRGQWRNLNAWTEVYSQPNEVCPTLREHYNADPQVTAARESHTPAIPPVSCNGTIVYGSGLDWGSSGPYNPCWNTVLANYNQVGDYDDDLDVFGWMDAAIACITQAQSNTNSVGPPHGLSIVGIADANYHQVLSVMLPANHDTKLTPFPRTALEPGLYEFLVHFEGGGIYHHYEHFTSTVTLSADFADFVDINIYPVPVVGSAFSIDFDLEYAAEIEVTITNNVGVNYHHKLLEFELAGENKHVVEMQAPWPAGLYHAVFEYADGSTESLSFTVGE